MKRVKLDNLREVTMNDEAYEKVLEIVRANLICATCRLPYLKDNPQVAENMCLECFQKKYANKKLTYISVMKISDQGDVTHIFQDTDGYIYYTTTSSDNEPYKSIFETLMWWSYPVPKFAIREERQIELSTWNWNIYGKLGNSVLFIDYDPRYGDGIRTAFLTTRYGDTEEVNRRKGKFQKLFKEARAQIEATKDMRGYYHINGCEIAGIYETHIYEGVARLASAENDRKEGLSKA